MNWCARSDSFHSYPQIFALGHRALAELLLDPVIVEEKVDGSQFSFGLFDQGDGERVLRCRSKGAQLNLVAPEKMFMRAVDVAKELPLHLGWTYIVDKLIDTLRTPARWHKAIQHLREAGSLDDSPRDIGNLMKEVQADIEKECMDLISQKLAEWALPQIRRGVIRGLPEFYKELLLKRQFEVEA